ncbi:metal-dependent membrane protease [Geminocystis sp. NIES-3708]|uniref:CPBP family intramembrane glutamic endopeptidase n=1 Tax=Geminocystis sp. NIES-3708 TaxID=1615909 RepID=UPI0005FC5282|nr:type II CAAX endopeptidase family protein [Geminocystis sp. NIES-3708]BAQ62089.1 metal-dependent membrane protease [Geminocystis sp. NIES-3708]
MSFEHIKKYPFLARLGLFILALGIIWLPFAIPIYYLIGKKDPNLTTIITMAILFVIFLFLVKLWGKYIYDNNNIFSYYGLVNSKKNWQHLIKGLIIGFVSNWLLFAVEALFGWLSFQPPTMAFPKLVLEGFISAIGIGFAEELFFRGWLLSELEKDFSLGVSGGLNSLLFAVAHFIKPLSEVIRTIVTFPALLLLGYTLISAKRSHQNLLGISIGIHSGLVWGYYVVNVGEMITYTEKVPQWITGIDQNPIAGIMGLGFLAILLYFIKTSINTKYEKN